MNCKEFENWLLSEDKTLNNTVPEDVFEHLSICADCEQIYLLDTDIENRIDAAFVQEEIPSDLETKIDASLNLASHNPFVFTKKMTGLVAGIGAILVITYLSIFNNDPFKFQNLQQLSEKAILRHLKGDTTMTFDAAHIEQAIGMLSKELKFKVILPDLADKGFILLGGRICAVDKCRTAYLFYKNKEKPALYLLWIMTVLNLKWPTAAALTMSLKGVIQISGKKKARSMPWFIDLRHDFISRISPLKTLKTPLLFYIDKRLLFCGIPVSHCSIGVKKCAIYYRTGDCTMPKEGVFAKILTGGTINVGDAIERLGLNKLVEPL